MKYYVTYMYKSANNKDVEQTIIVEDEDTLAKSLRTIYGVGYKVKSIVPKEN